MTKFPRKFQNEYRQATIDGGITYFVGETVRALGSRGTILKVSQNSAYVQFSGFELEVRWSDIKKISTEERKQISRGHKKFALPEQVRPSTKHPTTVKRRGDVLPKQASADTELSGECARIIAERDKEIESLRRANEKLHETAERLTADCREYRGSESNVTPEGQIVPAPQPHKHEEPSATTKKNRSKQRRAKAAGSKSVESRDVSETIHANRSQREKQNARSYSRSEMCRIVADVLDIDPFSHHIKVYLDEEHDHIVIVTQFESQKKALEEKFGYNTSTEHLKAISFERHNETYYVFIVDQLAQDSILLRYLEMPYPATVRHIFPNSKIEASRAGVRFHPVRKDEIDIYLKTLSDSGVHYKYDHTKNKKTRIENHEFILTIDEWNELRDWFDTQAQASGSWNDHYSNDLPFYIKLGMKNATGEQAQNEQSSDANSAEGGNETEQSHRSDESSTNESTTEESNDDLDQAESSMNAIQELLKKALKK